MHQKIKKSHRIKPLDLKWIQKGQFINCFNHLFVKHWQQNTTKTCTTQPQNYHHPMRAYTGLLKLIYVGQTGLYLYLNLASKLLYFCRRNKQLQAFSSNIYLSLNKNVLLKALNIPYQTSFCEHMNKEHPPNHLLHRITLFSNPIILFNVIRNFASGLIYFV